MATDRAENERNFASKFGNILAKFCKFSNVVERQDEPLRRQFPASVAAAIRATAAGVAEELEREELEREEELERAEGQRKKLHGRPALKN